MQQMYVADANPSIPLFFGWPRVFTEMLFFYRRDNTTIITRPLSKIRSMSYHKFYCLLREEGRDFSQNTDEWPLCGPY